jgi:hypothetical protein
MMSEQEVDDQLEILNAIANDKSTYDNTTGKKEERGEKQKVIRKNCYISYLPSMTSKFLTQQPSIY